MNFDNCILYIRSENELRLLSVYDIIVLNIKENIFEKVWWLYAADALGNDGHRAQHVSYRTDQYPHRCCGVRSLVVY